MPTPLPIACTLGAGALATRLDELRAVGQAALRGTALDGARAVLTFDPAPGIRGRLAAIVAAEAQCCTFLAMTLAEEPDTLRLTIDAPAEAGQVLDALLSAFGQPSG